MLMSTEELIVEIDLLKKENEYLKKQLENYNNSRKSYYKKNKEIVKQKAKDRLKKWQKKILIKLESMLRGHIKNKKILYSLKNKQQNI